MNWDDATTIRFTELRQRDLAGLLDDAERAELAALITGLEQAEEKQLANASRKMQAEQASLSLQLRNLRQENQELAKLQTQLELLVADARQWLAELERRHLVIQQTYSRLAAGSLITP
jgi:ribonuclease HI